MSIDKEKNVLSIKNSSGTIEVRPHPEEIIEVAPEILALMEARLSGQSFVDVYGDEDKVSQEFLIRKEIEKLKRVFGSSDQVSKKFQSVKQIKEMRQELQFEELNRNLLGEYVLKKSGGQFVDECDLYSSLLSGSDLTTKAVRFQNGIKTASSIPELNQLLTALKQQYLSENMEPLQITKEVIQLEQNVLSLVKEDKAVVTMNQLLSVFYGEAQ